MALPSGYTPLKYIESTGSQYVDTKLVINKTDLYEYILDSLLTNDTFGGANGYLQFEGSISGGKRVTIRVSYDGSTHVTTVYVDGVVFSTTDWTSSYSGENVKIGILRMGNAGDVWYTSDPQTGKVYSCQVKKNGSLVRDFIPCQTSSGEVGLYDDVNGVFYGNAGTGAFIAGPVAVQPEAPETLEVIGTTQNAVVLAWPAVPVDQLYRLYRDGVVVYEGTDLHCTDSGLAAGSSHIYSVHGLGGTVETKGVTAEATTTEGIVLITDRTAADVYSGNRKGRYNTVDLIRVGEAMLYAQSLLAQSGFGVSIDPKLDWTLDDIPTHAQMERYLADIRTLRFTMGLISSTPQVPESMSGLTWKQANDIETIIKNIEYTVDHIFAGLFRTGQFDAWAGDRRPFPTSNSDMGRNWEELDAMNTSWENWELATWYLLLYGNLKEEGVVS